MRHVTLILNMRPVHNMSFDIMFHPNHILSNIVRSICITRIYPIKYASQCLRGNVSWQLVITVCGVSPI